MLKPSTILTCLLFIGSMGVLKAAPLDSPGTVYIHGLPCNNACQSYMAWSQEDSQRRVPVSSQPAASQPSTTAEAQRTNKTTTNKAAPARVAKEATPKRGDGRPAKNANLVRVDKTAKSAVPKTAAVPHEEKTADPTAVAPRPDSQAEEAAKQTAANRAVEDQAPVAPDASSVTGSETEKATGPGANTPASNDRTIATSRPAESSDSDTRPSAVAKAISPGDAETTTPASPDTDQLVAVLFVRPEIKSVSDLAHKVVAIDASDTVSVARVRTAIVSGGAVRGKIERGRTDGSLAGDGWRSVGCRCDFSISKSRGDMDGSSGFQHPTTTARADFDEGKTRIASKQSVTNQATLETALGVVRI